MTDLVSLKSNKAVLENEPDVVHFLDFGSNFLNNTYFFSPYPAIPQISHASLGGFPFSILSQRYLLNDSMFCNESTIAKSCEYEFCECPYSINVSKYDTSKFFFDAC